MVDRLQKTIQDIPEKTVASPGNPLPPDTQTADLISTVGAAVGDVIKVRRKEEVETELRQLGSEVLVAQRGGDLKNATDRFKVLKLAQEQGRLTDTMINIEAEAIIKSVTAKSPGFGEDIRREAASILGFDPTGSQIQGLFGKSGRNRPTTPRTAQQKMMEQAEAIAAGTGTDPNDMYGLLAKAQQVELQKTITAFAATQGQAGANQVFQAHQIGLDTQLAGFMGTLAIDMQQGTLNPKDTVALKGRLSELQQRSVLELQKDLPSGTTVAQTASFRASIKTSFDLVEAAIDNGTLESLLTSQKNAYTQSAAILGFETFPGLSAIGASPLGQEGVASYLKAVNNVRNPRQLELMAANNPVLASIIDNRGAMAQKMSDAFQRVTGVKNADGSPFKNATEEVDLVVDDIVHSTIVGSETSQVVREAALERAKAEGKIHKDFSMYAQPKARALATDREVKYVVDNFDPKLNSVLTSMKSEMSGRDDIILSIRADGSIKIVARPDLGTSQQFVPFKQDTSFDFKSNVRRLEVYNKLLQNGWSRDVGRDPSSFLGRVIDDLNKAVPGTSDELAPPKPSRRRFNPASGTFETIE